MLGDIPELLGVAIVAAAGVGLDGGAEATLS